MPIRPRHTQPILVSYNLIHPCLSDHGEIPYGRCRLRDAFDADKPEAKAFTEAYVKEYHEQPPTLLADGWDGIDFIAQAIEKAGSLDKKDKLRAAMALDDERCSGAIGAKGTSWGASYGKRTGFDPQGAVVRIIKDNQHEPVVFAWYEFVFRDLLRCHCLRKRAIQYSRQ